MIQAEHIHFSYARRSEVFRDLSLRLDEGCIHGLLGCNGVGKSTLLKLFCGLLRSDKGRIVVDGADPGRRPVELLARMILLPEEPVLPAVSAARFAAVTAPFYPDWSAEQFDRCCRELEVDPARRLDRCSMGQRKKAFLAFALACNVPILLLDEPTNGLDIPSKGTFRRLLAAYAAPERTVLIATHQVREVENLIDNVVICDRDGIVVNAPTTEVTRRLRFGVVGSDALYAEKGLNGDMGVGENRDGTETRLDLELLFNAAVHRRSEIVRIMNPKNDADHE